MSDANNITQTKEEPAQTKEEPAQTTETPTLLYSKPVINDLKATLKAEIEQRTIIGYDTELTVITVGEDPASKVYVRNKKRFAEEIGVEFSQLKLPVSTTTEDLIGYIQQTHNPMILQLPVPKESDIDIDTVLRAIPTQYDADGFKNTFSESTIENASVPCTPRGIMAILDFYNIDLDGKDIVVIGRSKIVGLPIAKMLTDRNATVTTCHSHTKDIAKYTKNADIIVSAVGIPNFVTADMLNTQSDANKPVIIDVGMNRDPETNKLCGDVNFKSVKGYVKAITPVPKGVGPMTVAMLLLQTVELTQADADNKRDSKAMVDKVVGYFDRIGIL